MPADLTLRNTDVSPARFSPGFLFAINFRSPTAARSQIQRLLLLGYGTSAATYPLNQPVLVTGKTDYDTKFGRGSDLAREIAAAVDEVGSGAIPIYGCRIAEPSGGVASAYQIIVAGTATAAGYVEVFVVGVGPAVVNIANGDTASTIASALKTQLDGLLDAPLTWGVASATVTGTYRVKGVHGEDLPIRVNQYGAAGITFSPGSLTFASAAVGAGSVQVKSGAIAATASLAGGEAASAIATAVNTAINGGATPVPFTSAVNGVDNTKVDLFYAPDRDLRRVTAKVITSTGTTINGVAAGSTASIGTSGSNSPGSGTPQFLVRLIGREME